MQSITEKDLKKLHDRIKTLERAVEQPVAPSDDTLRSLNEELGMHLSESQGEVEGLKNTIAEQAETILSLTAGKQPEAEESSDPVIVHAPTFDEEGD